MAAFNLLELAVTTAIVAVLTAIAIPVVQHFRYEAKDSELALVIGGLDQVLGPYSEAMTWHRFFAPDTQGYGPGAQPDMPYDSPDFVFGKTSGPWRSDLYWDDIEYHPDGMLYCRYGITLYDYTMVPANFSHDANGSCDADSDGEALVRDAQRQRPERQTVITTGCNGGDTPVCHEVCKNGDCTVACDGVNTDGRCY